MRIAISPQGISIDQTDYIQGVLREYGFGPADDVPKVKGPFPTDSKFEVELFNSLPLDANEHKPYVEKHKGTLAKWTGALMHPQVWTRYDLGYSVMCLSGYMAAPTSASYQALHHVMCYLYHHQHFPIMYPAKKLKDDKRIELHWGRGEAEKLHHSDLLENFDNADFARDLRDRRSVTSTVHLLNGVAVMWSCSKQTSTSLHSTGAKIRALHKGVRGSIFARNFLAGIGFPHGRPVVTYEDNQATVAAVLADRTMPRLRHIDVLISSLHEWHSSKHFTVHQTKTNMMLADVNTKPQSGDTFALPPHLSRTWSTFLSSTRHQPLQAGTIRLVQDAELDTIWIALQVGF